MMKIKTLLAGACLALATALPIQAKAADPTCGDLRYAIKHQDRGLFYRIGLWQMPLITTLFHIPMDAAHQGELAGIGAQIKDVCFPQGVDQPGNDGLSLGTIIRAIAAAEIGP